MKDEALVYLIEKRTPWVSHSAWTTMEAHATRDEAFTAIRQWYANDECRITQVAAKGLLKTLLESY